MRGREGGRKQGKTARTAGRRSARSAPEDEQVCRETQKYSISFSGYFALAGGAKLAAFSGCRRPALWGRQVCSAARFFCEFRHYPLSLLGVHAPGARSRHVAARACASGRGSGAGFCGSKPSDAGFSQGIRHAAGGIPALETGAGHTGRIKVELKPVLNAGGASEPAVDAKTV